MKKTETVVIEMTAKEYQGLIQVLADVYDLANEPLSTPDVRADCISEDSVQEAFRLLTALGEM
jgi:hypothetical protein